MSLLNSVEINKIKVTPLSEWNYLLKRTPPRSCAWPERSDLLCWWCCSAFSNVPAYLPVKVDIDVAKKEGTFVFTGNFCSWNCVKRYAVHLEQHKKHPKGCFYIGLLAYLTVCKSTPCEDPVLHDVGLCDCVDKYRGVSLPLGREVLASFGGVLTIEEYRRDFHVITDYESIRRNFSDVQDVTRLQSRALRSPNAKFWGFHYLHYAGPDTSYTTCVSILPLTNRTFDKRTLVTTGNETNGADTQKLTEGASARSKKQSAPRAQKINNRRSNKSCQPVALSSIHETTTTTVDAVGEVPDIPTLVPPSSSGPLQRAFKKASGPMMTKEQVLACNDEQQFYTNSLRGYGNILTSMGIQVSNPPPK